MEVALLNAQTVRLRGKQGTLLIDPMVTKSKIPVDATLFFTRMPNNFPVELLEGNKIIIDGAGEYEIGGIKISGYQQDNGFYYETSVDGVDVLTANASLLSKIKEIKECEVAVIRADILLEQAVIAALNPSVVLFYGEKAAETVKALGKEDSAQVSKFAVTKEKLPQDTQILLLQ